MHKDDRLPVKPFIEGYNVSNPQFSPNGKYIAYLNKSDLGTDLVIYELSTGLHQELLVNHEITTGTAYGGETYGWAADSSSIVFANDGQLYQISLKGGEPQKIESIDKSFHPQLDERGLYFIIEHEDHMSLSFSDKRGEEYDWPRKVDIQRHFIYDPVRHKDGYYIAHVWDYPHMSWDGSSIVKISQDGEVSTIAGGGDIATAQPRLSPDQVHLSFISEETGWGNLWVGDASGDNIRVLVKEEAEHSYATWTSGARNQVWVDNEHIVFTRNIGGQFSLAITDLEGNMVELELPRGYYEYLSTDHHSKFCYIFSNYQNKSELGYIELDQDGTIKEHRIIATSGIIIDKYKPRLVVPETYSFPTKDGNRAHGLIYRPDTSKYPGKRPLLITVHGGPTGMFYHKFSFDPQYFVDQGWIVLGINHRGSIGYGKEFRQILMGKWGIYDVDDCVDAINHLSESGEINRNKVAIMGGSAGGFTTLMALVRHPGVFAAGVCLYGVADMFLLAEETHYLEAHYLDMLLGELPDEAEKYYNRSPINQADKIEDPILLLQGEDDPVVPKNQSDLIFEKIQGIKEYKVYEGEGHGFRKTKTLNDMYPRIDSFLRKHVMNKVK